MVKISYGESNFEKLVRTNSLYVDRTNYIEELENFFSDYLVFLRPRRFGKSLFISLLEYYYGIQYKDKFDMLFSKYYIGKNPTPLANQYLILRFDFSQIDTSSFKNTFSGFLNNTKHGALNFYGQYSQFFNEEDIEKIHQCDFPAKVIQEVVETCKIKAPNQKVYLLVDEYDHFANEILSFRFTEFSKMVGRNGFVRKFYEAIKVGTGVGVVDKLFITGVSPLTLDSFTSGFNISTNITLRPEFNEMMGFTKAEVIEILKKINIPANEIPATMELMKAWYDGYLFNKEANQHVYNSDMVLYFATEYLSRGKYPDELLDPNIASDYNKVRRLFKIKNNETEHFKYLDELLENGEVRSPLVRQFELEKRFVKQDFISLLFYSGILTITSEQFGLYTFRMPNYVIQQLYFQYFHQMLLERSQLINTSINLHEKLIALALNNEMQPLVEYTQTLLRELSNRDKQRFDEKHIKIIFTSVFFNVGFYNIHNEFEANKSETDKGYVDILLSSRPPFPTKYQFAIEIKYLKKEDAKKLESTKNQAIKQLKAYLQNDDYLKGLKNLKAYVVIFVGNEGTAIEIEKW